MSIKKLCIVSLMSFAIIGNSMVQADSPQERQQKIAELQRKKMLKPHKAAKYDRKIQEEQQKMRMGH